MERLTQHMQYRHQDNEVTALGSARAASRVSKLAETYIITQTGAPIGKPFASTPAEI
jgi:hypothetical protein